MNFIYRDIETYYDKSYWDSPGIKSGYTNMTKAVGGQWHDQACGWFNSAIPVNDKKLLDAGCGLGHFLVGFQKFGAEVYGCDVSIYSKYLISGWLSGYFFHTRLEDMRGVPDEFFDIIYCGATMEHIPQELVELVFQNLIRVAKPDGIIYMEIDTLPNEKRSMPEDSHVNIRPWGAWLAEIERPIYWWMHDFEIEEQLRNEKRFPGFPHKDWNFVVMRKNTG